MKITLTSGKATVTFPAHDEESDKITLTIGTRMALRVAKILSKFPAQKMKMFAALAYGALSLYGLGGTFELLRPLINTKDLEAALDKGSARIVSEANSTIGEKKNVS